MTNVASPHASGKVSKGQKGTKRNPFAVLLSDKDGRRFCLSAMVARLPMSMMSLGTVLAIRAIYHDWTAAGTVSAVYVLSAALVTPFYARCFDRFGQRKTGNIALPLSNIFLLAYILAMVFRLPLWLIYIFAIGLGLTQFSFGALARTRWTWLLRHRVSTGDLTQARASSLLGTAFALESAIDEFLFVIGPILATTMASVNPISQLVLPLVAQVIGGTVFFALKTANVSTRSLQQITVQTPNQEPNQKPGRTIDQATHRQADTQKASVQNVSDGVKMEDTKGTEPEVLTREPGEPPINDQQRLELLDAGRKNAIRKMLRRTETRTALGFPGILTLVCMFAIYNSSFSAYDVSVVALYEAQGKKALSGVLLAIYSVGSLVGALIYGSRTWKMPLWVRLISLMTGLVFGFILIDLVKENVWLFIPAAFLAGMVISPTYATANMIVEDNVPGTFLTEGLSWMNTASSVGSSLGSTLVGIVLDHWGVQYSFAISWLAVLAATIFVIAARPWAFKELKMYRQARHSSSSSPSAKRSRVA